MRTVHININDSDEIPQFINNFTNEENLLMLLIGSQFVLKGTQSISPLIMKDILQEKQQQIDNLTNEIEYQKRFCKDLVENNEQQKIKEINDII